MRLILEILWYLLWCSRILNKIYHRACCGDACVTKPNSRLIGCQLPCTSLYYYPRCTNTCGGECYICLSNMSARSCYQLLINSLALRGPKILASVQRVLHKKKIGIFYISLYIFNIPIIVSYQFKNNSNPKTTRLRLKQLTNIYLSLVEFYEGNFFMSCYQQRYCQHINSFIFSELIEFSLWFLINKT